MTDDPETPSRSKFYTPAKSMQELRERYLQPRGESPVLDALPQPLDQKKLPPGDYSYFKDLGPAGKNS
jgi:hypothetical protein